MVGKTALGKYQLLRSLGAGSNAEVFLAQPLRYPEYRVVVKRIHAHAARHPKFRQLFEAEVRSMARFTHPYAVRLLDAQVDDPIGPCLVMEYVPGITLEDLLRKHKLLHPDRAGRLLGFLCHALHAAHAAGIVHRDLKPANLMVVGADTPTESLKVMDFGFAGFSAKPHIQLAELTGDGPIHAIGTPGYVSPEMIRGDRVDGRSDLYSVGVILYEMLTGRLPFEQDILEDLLAAHVHSAPPRFHKIGAAHIPPEMEAVVQLALSKYPNERQQTAGELSEAFDKAGGTQFWDDTCPMAEEESSKVVIRHPTPMARPAPDLPDDPFLLSCEFEVVLPERLAAAKLRGFVEDLGGQVLTSDPGLIRLRLGLPSGYQETPSTGSSLFGWISTRRKPAVTQGQEPIEIDLHLNKPDPSQVQLNVLVSFRPLREYTPVNPMQWRTRCEKIHDMLRRYLGA